MALIGYNLLDQAISIINVTSRPPLICNVSLYFWKMAALSLSKFHVLSLEAVTILIILNSYVIIWW